MDMSDPLSTAPLGQEFLATRYVLSRIVGKASGRNLTWQLCRLLELLADDELELVGPGEDGGWPSNALPYRQCGLSGDDIDRLFRKAAKAEPLLDAGLLDAFVPRTLWPVIEGLIIDGPDLAFTQIEDLLRTLAKGELETRGRTFGESLSVGGVDRLRAAFLALASELNNLRKATDKLALVPKHRGKLLLKPWLASDYPKLPRGRALNARPPHLDRSSPPRRFIRLLIFALDWEIAQRRASGN